MSSLLISPLKVFFIPRIVSFSNLYRSFVVLSQNFHLSANKALLFLYVVYFIHLSSYYINHSCFNFPRCSFQYPCHIIGWSDARYILQKDSKCFLLFGMSYNFFLIAWHNVLGKRTCCKLAISKVMVSVGKREAFYSPIIRS